tara:strand:+ start:5496 stop:6548 length:1053 start_codon:yes stop_codon:yes gene_type:complete
MKLISIVGTRPQFLKLAPLSETFSNNNVDHKIIHTGQHYNFELSDEIFETLNIKKPEYHINLKDAAGVFRFTLMMNKITEIFKEEKPDKVIVYGDCDTTLAGALVAKIMKIHLVHIESGMRSYNKNMPEEINRIATDHISDILLCSSNDAKKYLHSENIKKNIHYVGNLQIELCEKISNMNNNNKLLLNKYDIDENNYVFLTLHRDYNTNETQITYILNMLSELDINIIFPIHPRTQKVIDNKRIKVPSNIKIIPPVDFITSVILQKFSKYIISDSGGIQNEAWFLDKKCIVMRTETEWMEAIDAKNNILYDYSTPLEKFIKKFLLVKSEKFNFNEKPSINILNILCNDL